MKNYEQQRKDRLQNVIDDYLQDETISSRQVFEEILSCINDVAEYHGEVMPWYLIGGEHEVPVCDIGSIDQCDED